MAEIDINPYHQHGALNRAIERRKEFDSYGNFSSLLYSALDTRLCIERTLFLYLLLIKNNELTARLEGLYDATDLKKAILTEEPAFFRKIEFCQLVAPLMGYKTTVVSPNLELLGRCYGMIGAYLHTPKRPLETWMRTAWWGKLKATLDETLSHLVDIHSGHLAVIEFKPSGQELFDKFCSGKLSSDELIGEIKSGMKATDISKSRYFLSPRRGKKT